MIKINFFVYTVIILTGILIFGAVSPAQAIRPKELIELKTFGNRDVGAALVEPSSIWFDRYRNRIIVTSTGNHRVMVYTVDGLLLHTLGKDGNLEFPYGVATDRSGSLYISEKESGKIKILRHYDEVLEQELDEKFADLALDKIQGEKPMKAGRLYIWNDDLLYVIDRANHRVLVLNPDGSLVLSIGSRGLGSGKFLDPADLCMDVSGRIYVSDPGAQRIQVFSREGKFLYRLGRDIRRVQGIDHAEGIVPDRFHNFWMSDRVKQNLFVEDGNGNRILTFPESSITGVTFFFPVDLVFDTTDRLFVLEQGAGLVRVFEVRY